MPNGEAMPLEQEVAYYNSIRAELIKNHEGKFALIKGEKLFGVFDQAESAYGEGVKLFGSQTFLVKQILRDDPVETTATLTVGLLNARL